MYVMADDTCDTPWPNRSERQLVALILSFANQYKVHKRKIGLDNMRLLIVEINLTHTIQFAETLADTEWCMQSMQTLSKNN